MYNYICCKIIKTKKSKQTNISICTNKVHVCRSGQPFSKLKLLSHSLASKFTGIHGRYSSNYLKYFGIYISLYKLPNDAFSECCWYIWKFVGT